MTTAVSQTANSPPFSHEALFYAGTREYVEQNASFIREGLAADEPVLVMVPADKGELLRAQLGPEADRVCFVDMRDAGRNPGRIISAWNDFGAEHRAENPRLRGIGEPIWAGRSGDELVECQHHESLINLAFEGAHGFRLLCPYDTDALPPAVIDEARRSHPLVLEHDRPRPCEGYRGTEAIGLEDSPLPPPRAPSEEMSFHERTLEIVRRFVSAHAGEAGLAPDRSYDLVLAVNEAATNSVRYAGGQGVIRIWEDDGSGLVCEIRDSGRMVNNPLVGRRRPADGRNGGRGLWLAHQLCDLVQLRSGHTGTVVRLHMRLSY
jgi:anti-sigma regulatory factor (Ser/Thr protein kinase)